MYNKVSNYYFFLHKDSEQFGDHFDKNRYFFNHWTDSNDIVAIRGKYTFFTLIWQIFCKPSFWSISWENKNLPKTQFLPQKGWKGDSTSQSLYSCLNRKRSNLAPLKYIPYPILICAGTIFFLKSDDRFGYSTLEKNISSGIEKNASLYIMVRIGCALLFYSLYLLYLYIHYKLLVHLNLMYLVICLAAGGFNASFFGSWTIECTTVLWSIHIQTSCNTV